jgi:hypothetical protein
MLCSEKVFRSDIKSDIEPGLDDLDILLQLLYGLHEMVIFGRCIFGYLRADEMYELPYFADIAGVNIIGRIQRVQ